MFKPLFFFVIITLCYSCSAPKPIVTKTKTNPYQGRYLDQLDEGSKLIDAYYHWSIEETSTGQYVYKQYFPENNQITKKQTYKDQKMKIRHGLHQKWTDEGILFSEGQYIDDQKSGEWKNYSFTKGKLYSYGNYTNGQKNGVWINLDTLGKKTSEYHFKNDKKHGTFKKYNKAGAVVQIGEYTNGEETLSKTLIDEPHQETFKMVEVMPQFPGCESEIADKRKDCADREMLMFIYKNIKYPHFAREMGIEGTALMTFVIYKDGSVKEIKSINGICSPIRDECIRVIELMPDWHAGLQNGEPVKVQFNLPIKFRLE